MPDPLLDEAARIRTRSGRTAEVVGLLADRIAELELDNEGLSRHTALMERHRMGEARLAAAGRAVLAAWDVTPSDIWHAQQAKVALDGLRGLVDGQPTSDRDHLLSTALAYQATYTGHPTDDPWVQAQRDANDAEIERLQPTDEPTEADPDAMRAAVGVAIAAAVNAGYGKPSAADVAILREIVLEQLRLEGYEVRALVGGRPDPYDDAAFAGVIATCLAGSEWGPGGVEIGEECADLADEIVAELRTAGLVGGRSAACPHIVTSDGGTSYCDLAEGGRSAAPTRDEVRAAICAASPAEGAKHTLGQLYNDTVLDNATDAVVALLEGRSDA